MHDGGGSIRSSARSENVDKGGQGTVLVGLDAKGTCGGATGCFIRVKLGLPTTNPVNTGVGARSRAESLLLASWGRRKGDCDTDTRAQSGSERKGEGIALLGQEVGSGFCSASADLGRGREGRRGRWATQKGKSWAPEQPRMRFSFFSFVFLLFKSYFKSLFKISFEILLNFSQSHTVQKYKCSSMSAHTCY